MPELPEVETITQGISTVIKNANVTGIEFFRDNLRDVIPKKEIKQILIQQEVINIFRRSKYIILESKKGYVIIHLGMTGNVLFYPVNEPQHKHTHVIIEFKSSKNTVVGYLHYVDPRRFGRFAYHKGKNVLDHELLINLGPEPLETKDLAKHLFNTSRNKKVPIKSFLMDAHHVVGVGNIYAAESLFQAKLHPLTLCNEVTLEQFKTISQAVKNTLKRAIKAGGTTLKDFKSTKGDPGYFAISLQVYGRTSEPCLVCDTVIENVKIAGRSSFFCPKCQMKI